MKQLTVLLALFSALPIVAAPLVAQNGLVVSNSLSVRGGAGYVNIQNAAGASSITMAASNGVVVATNFVGSGALLTGTPSTTALVTGPGMAVKFTGWGNVADISVDASALNGIWPLGPLSGYPLTGGFGLQLGDGGNVGFPGGTPIWFITNSIYNNSGNPVAYSSTNDLSAATWNDQDAGLLTGFTTTLMRTNSGVPSAANLLSGGVYVNGPVTAAVVQASSYVGPLQGSNVVAFTLPQPSLDNTNFILQQIGSPQLLRHWGRYAYTNVLAKVQAGRPVGIVLFGSGLINEAVFWFQVSLTNGLTYAGGNLLQPGNAGVVVTGGAAVTNDCSQSILGTTVPTWANDWIWMPASSTVQYFTNYPANNVFEVDYGIYSGGGTLKFETNINNTTWSNVVGFTAVPTTGSTLGGVVRWTNAGGAFPTSVRITASGSPCKVLSIGGYNTTISNGVYVWSYSGQNTSPDVQNRVLTNNYVPILQSWNPDMLIVSYNNGSEQYLTNTWFPQAGATNVTYMGTNLMYYLPNTFQVHLGCYSSGDVSMRGANGGATGFEGANLFLRRMAQAYSTNVAYFDSWGFFGGSKAATNWTTRLGLDASVHLQGPAVSPYPSAPPLSFSDYRFWSDGVWAWLDLLPHTSIGGGGLANPLTADLNAGGNSITNIFTLGNPTGLSHWTMDAGGTLSMLSPGAYYNLFNTGDAAFSGGLTADHFIGIGSALTGLTPGQIGAQPTNAALTTLGVGSGAALTNLNASALASGTVPTARLGSGTANSGTILYGDNTWGAPPAGGSGATLAGTNVLTGSNTFAGVVSATNAANVFAGNGAGITGLIGGLVSVKQFGALGDGVQLTNCAITSGAATLTCAQANFTAGDVGKVILVTGAGAGGTNYDLRTTISTRNSATSVTLTANAGTTVSSGPARYGTDDTTPFLKALAQITNGNLHLFVPAGNYVINGNLDPVKKSQLYLPDIPSTIPWGPTLTIEGEGPPTQLFISDGSLSNRFTSYGSQLWGTLIGSNFGSFFDPQNATTPAHDNFNNVGVIIKRMGLRLPANPQISGWNLGYASNGKVLDYAVDTGFPEFGSAPQPTATNSFGIIMPRVNNSGSGVNRIDSGYVYGFNTLYRLSEHDTMIQACGVMGNVGIQFDAGYHSCTVLDYNAEGVKTNFFWTGPLDTMILRADIEHDAGWYSVVYDACDPNNYAQADIHWTVTSTTGFVGTTNDFRVQGGSNIRRSRYGQLPQLASHAFTSPTNALALQNGITEFSAVTPCAITNVSGVTGSYETVRFFNNAGTNITVFVTDANVTFFGASTNGLVIPSGKSGTVGFMRYASAIDCADGVTQ